MQFLLRREFWGEGIWKDFGGIWAILFFQHRDTEDAELHREVIPFSA